MVFVSIFLLPDFPTLNFVHTQTNTCMTTTKQPTVLFTFEGWLDSGQGFVFLMMHFFLCANVLWYPTYAYCILTNKKTQKGM